MVAQRGEPRQGIMRFIVIAMILTLAGCGNGFEWLPSSSGGNSSSTTTPAATSTYTALCANGQTSTSDNCPGTCSQNGGVSLWYTTSCGSATAVATCKDGKVSTSETCTAVCVANGGVLVWHTTSCGGTVAKAVLFAPYTSNKIEAVMVTSGI